MTARIPVRGLARDALAEMDLRALGCAAEDRPSFEALARCYADGVLVVSREDAPLVGRALTDLCNEEDATAEKLRGTELAAPARASRDALSRLAVRVWRAAA